MTRPTREEVDSSELFLLAYFHQDLVLPRTQVGGAVEVVLAEVRALREELASENSEARRIFTKEFQAELLERTQECDRLRATIARVEACLDECAQTEGADETYVYVYAVHDALRGQP